MPAPAAPSIVIEEARDPRFWTSKYPSVKIDRLRKTITVLPFTVKSGPAQGCMEINPLSSYSISTHIQGGGLPSITGMSNAFTLEAWIKPFRIFDSPILQGIISFEDLSSAYYLFLHLDRSFLKMQVYTGGNPRTLTSYTKITPNEWTHVAVVYDGTKLKLYINGVLDSRTLKGNTTNGNAVISNVDTTNLSVDMGVSGSGIPANSKIVTVGATSITLNNNATATATGVELTLNSLDIAAPLQDLSTIFKRYIAEGDESNYKWGGKIDEVRIWNVARTVDDLVKWKNRSLRGVETGLLHYFQFSETSGNWLDKVNNTFFISIDGGYANRNTTDGFPHKLGASFIGAKIKCSLGKKISLNHPLPAPANIDFGLYISWTDKNGDFQRRTIWTLDELDVFSIPDYNGEILEDPFYLEFWNKDGDSSIVLAENLVLETSLAARPLTSIDTTAQKALTDAVADDYIYETLNGNSKFPLPMIFDTQPLFT